jgi:hypothetical protein
MAQTKAEKQQEKVDAVLNGIVDLFTDGDVAGAVAIATFPTPDIPMAAWSLRNRVIAMIAGTGDARGFRAWQKIGRCVQKGRRAFYILAPKTFKSKTEVDAKGKPKQASVDRGGRGLGDRHSYRRVRGARLRLDGR